MADTRTRSNRMFSHSFEAILPWSQYAVAQNVAHRHVICAARGQHALLKCLDATRECTEELSAAPDEYMYCITAVLRGDLPRDVCSVRGTRVRARAHVGR